MCVCVCVCVCVIPNINLIINKSILFQVVLCMLMAKVIEALKCGIKFDAETTEKCYKPLRLTLSSIFYLATDGTTGNLSEGETDDSNKKQICGK